MLSLERQVDTLARLTERSRVYFDLYKFIEGADTRSKVLDQMNEYYWYFRWQGHIFRYALIVELGALFENSTESICFHSVLRRAKPQLNHKLYETISERLKHAEPFAQKITKLRNKAFAHRDSFTDFDQVFREAAITLNEIEELIEIARHICEQLCTSFAVQPPLFLTSETIEDCQRLFQKLGSTFD